MDISLEDTLASLGLDDEATVSPRTGRDSDGNFFTIPSGWSRSYREDSTLTPAQTPLAPGTPESYVDSIAGPGAPSALPVWDPGQHGHFRTPSLWTKGPTGTSQDDWCQCSTQCGSPPILSFAPPVSRDFARIPLACNPCPPFSSQPLYESSRLADPYPPVSACGWVGGSADRF